jgi:hypothetical protein
VVVGEREVSSTQIFGVFSRQETGSASASSQQHQPSAQQASYTETPLGTVSLSKVADALSKFPQSSTEPYQQQPQPVFGRNPQTPGLCTRPGDLP